MKRITAIIACAITLVACNKEKDKYYISAKIDGLSFYTDSVADPVQIGYPAPGYGCYETTTSITRLQIIGWEGFSYGLDFSIHNYTGKGSYTLGASGNNALYINLNPDRSGAVYAASNSGTLVIISDANDIVQGTFSAEVQCLNGNCNSGTVKHITSGKFRLPISHL